jgi:hypothetical protein
MHPDAKLLLDFCCDVAETMKLPRPMVTCMGRTREWQENHYWKRHYDKIMAVVKNGAAEKAARAIARKQWSWHCVAKDGPSEGTFRAFDLSIREMDSVQVHEFIRELERRCMEFLAGDRVDIVLHGDGDNRHIHCEIECKDGRPSDWY